MLDVFTLAQECAPGVHADTIRRIVSVESSGNPYAIGVVGGRLDRQPRTLDEALATMRWLKANGYNFSVGLAQVNKNNFKRYGLSEETAFEPCQNLRAGGAILKECYVRALKKGVDEQTALRNAFSCYYSGNFLTGYREGYVLKVVSAHVGLGGAQAAPKGRTTNPTAQRVKRGASTNQEEDELASEGGAQSALLF